MYCIVLMIAYSDAYRIPTVVESSDLCVFFCQRKKTYFSLCVHFLEA